MQVPKKEWYDSRGDATLHLSWTAAEPSAEASRVFLASCPGGGALCVLVVAPHAHLMTVSGGNGATALSSRVGLIPCLDACPVSDYSAIDPFTCIAVIKPTGKLSIYMGASPLRWVAMPLVPCERHAAEATCPGVVSVCRYNIGTSLYDLHIHM